MKRRVLTILIIALALVVMSLVTACSVDGLYVKTQVSEIAVDGIAKDVYFVGDSLELTGAKLYVTYEDGTFEIIDLKQSMISKGFNTESVGKKAVTVEYKGATTSFEIEVVDLVVEKVELATYPQKTTYIEGVDFDVAGATLKVTFVGGRTILQDISSSMVENYDSSVLGTQTVKIKYRSETIDIPNITVVKKTLTAISVKEMPEQTAIFRGESFSPYGLVLNRHFDNNLSDTVTARSVDLIYSYDNTKASPKSRVTVIYNPGAKLEDESEETYAQRIKTMAFVPNVYTATDNNPIPGYKTFFYITVEDRTWSSMSIINYPVTNGIVTKAAVFDSSGKKVENEVVAFKNSNINNIVQGDTLNLSTGSILVNFDDGSNEIYPMNHSKIMVYNLAAKDRQEIPGLSIAAKDVTGIPSGDYTFECAITQEADYPENYSPPTVSYTVISSSGQIVPINANNAFYVDQSLYYTVNVTATAIDALGEEHICERNTYVYGLNAAQERHKLNISAPGQYELLVVFSENENWSIKMNAEVNRSQVENIEIRNVDTVVKPDPYIIGDTINISYLEYRLIYDNGFITEWQTIERSMLNEECTLYCSEETTPTSKKTLTFSKEGKNVSLQVDVTAIKAIALDLTAPIKTHVSVGGELNPTGGYLTVYYNNNEKKIGLSLADLVKLPENPAIIRPDENSEDASGVANSIPSLVLADGYTPNPETAYYATVSYLGVEVSYPYYVVSRTLLGSKLDVRTNAQRGFVSRYYQNEALNTYEEDGVQYLSGVFLSLQWSGGIGTQDNVPVSVDMVYGFSWDDLSISGEQTIQILYWGLLGSFSVSVIPRAVTEIQILVEPLTLYIYGVNTSLNLNGIEINLLYNDGTKGVKYGLRARDLVSPNGNATGWWTNEREIDFSRINDDSLPYHTVVIFYRNNYNDVCQTSYRIRVIEATIKSLTFDPTLDKGNNNTLGGYLARVSKGMPLNISSMYLTVIFNGLESQPQYVPISATMVNYIASDITIGDRNVVITYGERSCNANVEVVDSTLTSIEVLILPIVDYTVGDSFEKEGGIILRTFTYNASSPLSGQTWSDHMEMTAENVYFDGFNSYSVDNTEAELEEFFDGEQYMSETINITYYGMKTDFFVNIHRKYNGVFAYTNYTSFYGDVATPSVTQQTDVEGFNLPDTSLGFISASSVVSRIADVSITEVREEYSKYEAAVTAGTLNEFYASCSNAELIKLSLYFYDNYGNKHNKKTLYLHKRLGGNYDVYLAIMVYEGEDVVTKYVRENYIQYPYFSQAANKVIMPTDYTIPPRTGDQYLMLAMMSGNKYYNNINYALNELKIIQKVIEVFAYTADESAVVLRYFTDNNSLAVDRLKLSVDYLSEGNDGEFSSYVELASPTSLYFDIIVKSISVGDSLDNIKNRVWNILSDTLQVGRVRGAVGIVVDFSTSDDLHAEAYLDTLAYNNSLRGGANTIIDFEYCYDEERVASYVRMKVTAFDVGVTLDILKQNVINCLETATPAPYSVSAVTYGVRRIDGVNYRVYGEANEIVSFYIESGGLINSEVLFGDAARIVSGENEDIQYSNVQYSVDGIKKSSLEVITQEQLSDFIPNSSIVERLGRALILKVLTDEEFGGIYQLSELTAAYPDTVEGNTGLATLITATQLIKLIDPRTQFLQNLDKDTIIHNLTREKILAGLTEVDYMRLDKAYLVGKHTSAEIAALLSPTQITLFYTDPLSSGASDSVTEIIGALDFDSILNTLSKNNLVAVIAFSDLIYELDTRLVNGPYGGYTNADFDENRLEIFESLKDYSESVIRGVFVGATDKPFFIQAIKGDTANDNYTLSVTTVLAQQLTVEQVLGFTDAENEINITISIDQLRTSIKQGGYSKVDDAKLVELISHWEKNAIAERFTLEELDSFAAFGSYAGSLSVKLNIFSNAREQLMEVGELTAADVEGRTNTSIYNDLLNEGQKTVWNTIMRKGGYFVGILEQSDIEGYITESKLASSEIAGYDIGSGTLNHRNYIIEFDSSDYRIDTKEIRAITFDGSVVNDGVVTYTTSRGINGAPVYIDVKITYEENGVEVIEEVSRESLLYFRKGEYDTPVIPSAAGEYICVVARNYKAENGYTLVWSCLVKLI